MATKQSRQKPKDKIIILKASLAVLSTRKTKPNKNSYNAKFN
jgi:hypothetical protein